MTSLKQHMEYYTIRCRIQLDLPELVLRPPDQFVRADHGDEGLHKDDLHELADEALLGELHKVILV